MQGHYDRNLEMLPYFLLGHAASREVIPDHFREVLTHPASCSRESKVCIVEDRKFYRQILKKRSRATLWQKHTAHGPTAG